MPEIHYLSLVSLSFLFFWGDYFTHLYFSFLQQKDCLVYSQQQTPLEWFLWTGLRIELRLPLVALKFS